jgi:GNAT superfamily N-acetyltransferase
VTIAVEPLTGDAIHAALPAVAKLRVAVFREWPYLYDGSEAYEQDYLAGLAAAANSVIVVARDGAEIVGVATGAPLPDHTDEFVPLFRDRGFEPERIFYFAESVLLPTYRGRGIGHAFFDHREAVARRAVGPAGAYSHAAFCGVVRDEADPRRPAVYRPLDDFWTKRGYAKVEGLIGSYTWREIGAAEDSTKPMQFWMRAL